MVFKILKSIAVITFLLLVFPQLSYARSYLFSSYSDEPERFLEAIENYRSSQPGGCKKDGMTVRAGIITHHFLASRMMVDFFECLSSQIEPERIVLIGPDHFAKGVQPITVSSLPWETPFGELAADESVANMIKESLDLSEDNEAFGGEHSIGIIVPFIRYYFPKSKIVPIIVQNQVPRYALTGLKRIVGQLLDDPKTIILLSMDFSHDQTSDEADSRDEMSRDVIRSLDYTQISSLDIDCKPGLFLLMSVLKESGNVNINFRHHTNSSVITGLKKIKNVTSYYTIFFYE
ncbi:MAG: AmmeMemoRadiSam system protein B [Nitrospirae bacterium]|nr:AmmeMemoRadiSam system protein B [Nitrospirota bacterium]